MPFIADFEIEGGIAFTSQNIQFTALDFDENGNALGVGIIPDYQIDNPQFEIDGNVTIDDVTESDGLGGRTFKSGYNLVQTNNKPEWRTSNGDFYSGKDLIYKFKTAGIYQVTYTIYSEYFNYNGEIFRYKLSKVKDVTIVSFFFKTLVKYYPLWHRARNNHLDDMFFSFSQFFDRMYEDNKRVFDNVDAEKIAPELFEYLAVTLGHRDDYVKKIGSDVNNSKFDTYDIYDNIKNGTATEEEIKNFRQFLLYSATLFKKKGTADNIEKLLSFYNIGSKIEELWTENWGTTSIGDIIEQFNGLDTFEDNSLGLKWENVRVVGNTEEKGHFEKRFNTILIDSYHKVDKLNYPDNAINDSLDDEYIKFPISHGPYHVLDYRFENGDTLVNEEIDNVADNSRITKINGNYYLEVKSDILNYGDRISLNYGISEDNVYDNLVANIEDKYQNLDINVRFNIRDVKDHYKGTNSLLPENEVFFLFRGNKIDLDKNQQVDKYANFNEYYRVSVNMRRSTFQVSKIFQNKKNGVIVTQNLNLSENKDSPIWEAIVINPETNEPYDFNFDKEYEIKMNVSGSYISIQFREAKDWETIQQNISFDIGGNEYGKDTNEWLDILENFSLNVDQVNVKSFDQEGNEIIDEKYELIEDKGYFGFGVRSGIIEISQISLDVLDLDDELFNTIDKELYKKPKYLEWQNSKLVSYNSYFNNNESFTQNISENFDSSNKKYNVNEKFASSIQYLYMDNANTDELIASRYTVSFDKEWVNDIFNSSEDVMDKIIVPFSGQKSYFLPETRIQNKKLYKNFNGTQETGSVGLFNYNISTTLGDYRTEVDDEFSHLTRDDDGYGFNLTLSQKINEYKNSDQTFLIRGIYEEVCPYSNKFTELGDVFELEDSVPFKNILFMPIVSQTASYNRVLGIRFRHCDDIRNIIERGRFENEDEVMLYGKYSFDMPNESIKYRPDLQNELPNSTKRNHVTVSAFLPIGVLNDSIQNYSLGVEFMHDVNNSGFTDIRLEGVYFQIPRNKFIYHEADNIIELEDLNPYENRSKGMKCRSYLCADLNLATKLVDFESTNDNSVSTEYIMDYSVRKMFNSFQSDYDTWNWWIPKELYRKRDFTRIYNEGENAVSTGINFDPNSNLAKSFFGKKFTAEEFDKGIPHQQFRFNDGDVTPNTTYYAKVIVRMNWSGFKESNLSTANKQLKDTEYDVRPLNRYEANNVKVLGGKQERYNNNTLAPTEKCLTFYMPISWSPSDVSGNTIEWANFIRGSHGKDNDATVTFTPYGLMTWMYQHATGNINSEEFLDDMIQVTSGWDIEDWNERFWKLVNIEFIAEKIPEDKYTLMDKYGFVTKYAPKTGAYVVVSYDVGDLDWKVYEDAYLVPSGLGGYYFEIPREIKEDRSWNEKVESIKLNNYVISSNLYEFSDPTTLTLKDDVIFSTFDGAKFNARIFFDLFFESNKFESITDNFDDKREINWTTYENTMSDRFELATRVPNTNVAFGLETCSAPSYNIINIEGKKSFQRNEDSTIVKFDRGMVGTNQYSDNNIVLDKNGGYKQTIHLIDNRNEVFEISTDVYFDEELNNIKDYNGKKFELILKANTYFNPENQKYNIEEYYFVGIGTFGFDISLGVARYDFFNNTIKKTFLAGFGDYNTRNIETNTWYKLKAIVDDKYIRVIFNEKNEKERSVINYNIDPVRKDDPDRYIKGEFEELVYLVTGLDNLNITYPATLQDKTNETFYKENWNQEYAISLRPSGPLSGMRIFNDLTYVGEVSYKAKIQDLRVYAEVTDVTDYSDVISNIRNKFKPEGEIRYIGKTLNSMIIVLLGNNLYYKPAGKEVAEYSTDVFDAFVYRNFIIVRFIENKTKFAVIDNNFLEHRNLFVKDNTFHTDHIYKYSRFTQRDIDRFWVSDGTIHIEFQPE